MKLVQLGRASLLALVFFSLSVTSGWAHALPGTVIEIWRENGLLQISITLPIEDLVIAEPSLADLAETEGVPNSADRDRLANYFAAHSVFQQGATALPMALTDAALGSDYNDHVGAFATVRLAFQAPLPAATLFPLTLQHDAVMHEVRNHRATVVWTPPDGPPQILDVFGYRTENGEPKPILLDLP